jgi:SRSO17 transposase
MDAAQIGSLQTELDEFLGEFADCFGRPEPREHLRTYIKGQLSDLPRKSIEPIALEAGIAPRTLQEFLSTARWDQDLMRQRLQQQVTRHYSHLQAIAAIDETSCAKKGDMTPGVKAQWCGSKGKKDNCVVTVHLSYATPTGFRALLDAELFLPEDWSADRRRCQEAKIPGDMVHRPKWQIALELRDRAVANGLPLPWLTFDEHYGMVNDFLFGLDDRGQFYVGEVPRNCHGWCKKPAPLHKQHHEHTRGVRWLKEKNPPVSSVVNLVRHSPAFCQQPWKTWHIKDSEKGPVVWQVKMAPFYLRRDGRPTYPHWLIAARSPFTGEIKYFVSNAPPGTPPEVLLYVAFGRYPIERCFEDQKTELGLDHFEVRNYCSLLRHLLITSITSLFLGRVRQRLKKNTGVNGLPGADRRRCDDPWPGDELLPACSLLQKGI